MENYDLESKALDNRKIEESNKKSKKKKIERAACRCALVTGNAIQSALGRGTGPHVSRSGARPMVRRVGESAARPREDHRLLVATRHVVVETSSSFWSQARDATVALRVSKNEARPTDLA